MPTLEDRSRPASINEPGTELDKQQVVTIAESCMSNLLT
jgi:hypothetical protein